MSETFNIETVREKLQALTRYDEESRGYDGTGIGQVHGGQFLALDDVLEIFGLVERHNWESCRLTVSIEKKE